MIKQKEQLNIENLDKNIGKDEITKDIVNRLRRIEGQVKGIEKMVSNESCCKDVLVQVAAVRAAINKVGGIILENSAKRCFTDENGNVSDDRIEELISTFLMFIK